MSHLDYRNATPTHNNEKWMCVWVSELNCFVVVVVVGCCLTERNIGNKRTTITSKSEDKRLLRHLHTLRTNVMSIYFNQWWRVVVVDICFCFFFGFIEFFAIWMVCARAFCMCKFCTLSHLCACLSIVYIRLCCRMVICIGNSFFCFCFFARLLNCWCMLLFDFVFWCVPTPHTRTPLFLSF